MEHTASKGADSSVERLLIEWRGDAELLRRYGHEATAAACELHARQVAAAMIAAASELLTLAEAAEETGFSVDHLGRLLREGKILNAGRKGAPRIRRTDLPRGVRPIGQQGRADPAPGPRPIAAGTWSIVACTLGALCRAGVGAHGARVRSAVQGRPAAPFAALWT